VPREVFAELNSNTTQGLGIARATASNGRPPDAILAGNAFDRSVAVASIDASGRSQQDETETLCHTLLATVRQFTQETHRAAISGGSVDDVPIDEDARHGVLEIIHGEMADQFTPLFFSVAYCFLFPHGDLGLPDLEYSHSTRPHRGAPQAPRVEFCELYSMLLVQRAEAVFRRDLTLSFALWQMVFRTKVNLGRHFYTAMREASRASDGEEHRYTYDEILDATNWILKGLRSEYTTEFTTIRVNGNIDLLKGHPDLSPLARSMLDSFKVAAADIEGTKEARTKLRAIVMGYRVRYGGHHMLTLSPNPQHSLLMIRLSRTMALDPIRFSDKELHAWGKRTVPSIVTACDRPERSVGATDDDAYIAVPIAPFLDQIPDLALRRRILAKDPLAQVYGFRMSIQIVLRTMLGVRICSDCPRCCESEFPCMDSFGAVHQPEGGVLGLVEAYAGAIEYQSGPGALHMHLLLFLKSVFQHRTPKEVVDHMGGRLKDLLVELENFKRHASDESYPLGAPRERAIRRVEESGRHGHEHEAVMVGRPPSTESLSGAAYIAACKRDVQELAMRTMHHTHPWCEETNQRTILATCRSDRDGPDTCKRGFPLTERLCDECKLLCHGLVHNRGLSRHHNFRNLTGSLMGPRNHEYLCDTPPALLRVVRCNVNLLAEHRLPPICELHDADCAQSDCHAYFGCTCTDCVASGRLGADGGGHSRG
jgi:hypothetical protein